MGHAHVVSFLLKSGADISLVNMYGNSALHESCRIGSDEITRQLIESSADVTAKNKKGSTPLHFMCYSTNTLVNPPEQVRRIIKLGADVNATDYKLATPLLVSAASGRIDLIKLLMEVRLLYFLLFCFVFVFLFGFVLFCSDDHHSNCSPPPF
jgi:ankyrin repeat protein